MTRKPPASLRSIGEQAGVSRSTVWLALRNDPRVQEATRERIQALAKEAGYHPSALVSTMLSQVRRRKPAKERVAIAWLSSLPPPLKQSAQQQPLMGEIFAGACQRAEELGYRIEEIWGKEPGMSGQRLT